MHAALIINPVGPNRNDNLRMMLSMAKQAASSGADLILFPEAALTGLVNNDDPVHDLPLSETIPGPVTDAIGALCKQLGIWLGTGILERKSDMFYDSAVLFNPMGQIALKYRRNQPQWHGRHADPSVYTEGKEIAKASTPFGSVTFLICGDLFDNEIVTRFNALKADWLLFPFARCFTDGSFDQQRWETEELPVYMERVKMVRTPAIMVNYLSTPDLNDGGTFGGAFVVSARGNIIAEYPLGKVGILFVDMEK